EVSARARNALCQPHRDRVSTHGHTDDRDVLGGCPGSSCGGNARSNDHVHLELHELHGAAVKIHLTFSGSHLENEILPFTIALLGEGITKCQEACVLPSGGLGDPW